MTPDELKALVAERESEYQEALNAQFQVMSSTHDAETAYVASLRAYVGALEEELERIRLLHGQPLARGSPDDLAIDITPIVKRLDSRNDRARIAARDAYRALGVRAVGPLLRVMRRESVLRDRRNGVIALVAIGATLLAIGSMVLTNLNQLAESGFFGFLLVGLGFGAFMTRPSSLQRTCARLLASFDDARVIGPLAEGLSFEDWYTHQEAAKGLIRLLPRLKATDAGLIEPFQLDCLYTALNSADSDLVIAILRGLEQVGDERALPHVERLVDRPVYSAQQERIRDAARACLPVLLARTDPDQASQRLLRPILDRVGGEDVLLRPAGSVTRDDEKLVRPVGLGDEL